MFQTATTAASHLLPLASSVLAPASETHLFSSIPTQRVLPPSVLPQGLLPQCGLPQRVLPQRVLPQRVLPQRVLPRRHRSRAKPQTSWEQLVSASGGVYAEFLREIASRFPRLTPMELRVAALVKAMLPSYEIARMLHVTEHTIENYRAGIRKKVQLPREASLASYLAGLA